MSSHFSLPSWEGRRFKAVIFDLDGTLYDQRQLRRIMAIELACYCLKHPSRLQHARILARFRRLREERFAHAEISLLQAQYQWTAAALKVELPLVQAVADEWLLRRPLRHLLACRPDGLAELFTGLRQKGIKIGVFSDYPVQEKLAALQLQPDAAACALDAEINRFKPHPAGVLHICERLQVNPAECLHIGDRSDRDAACAERCGCASLILPAHHAKRLGPEKTFASILRALTPDAPAAIISAFYFLLSPFL